MTIDIIAVGSLKEEYLRAGIEEFQKRLSAFGRVQIHELKEVRVANEDDAVAVERALEGEAEKILARLAPDAYKIALCVEGVQYDSVALASVPPEDPMVQLVCCMLVVIPPLFLFSYYNRELVDGIALVKEK